MVQKGNPAGLHGFADLKGKRIGAIAGSAADEYLRTIGVTVNIGARLLERTQEPAGKERLLQNTQASVERGTFGSPTFFVGQEIFFGKDRLRDVEEEIRGKASA